MGMFWYSLIVGVVSVFLSCVASVRICKEWLRKAPESSGAMKVRTGLQRKANRAYATRKLIVEVSLFPIMLSAVGVFMFAVAALYGCIDSAPLEQETVGIGIIGAGSVFGLLTAIIGWQVNRRDGGRWSLHSYQKYSVWGVSILLQAVAVVLTATYICVDWLVV